MTAAVALLAARRRAGLTQRELATAAGVSQPAIARVESGAVTPRVDTLQRLLAACGATLEVLPRLGDGVDRTSLRQMLRLSPLERLLSAAQEAANLDRFDAGRR